MIDRRSFLVISAGVTAAVATRASPAAAELDTAYINAKVWTGAGPAVRTDAIGVKGDRIATIGSPPSGPRPASAPALSSFRLRS